MSDRTQELERVLAEAVSWFDRHRPAVGPGTLPTWFSDGMRLLSVAKPERQDEKAEGC